MFDISYRARFSAKSPDVTVLVNKNGGQVGSVHMNRDQYNRFQSWEVAFNGGSSASIDKALPDLSKADRLMLVNGMTVKEESK